MLKDICSHNFTPFIGQSCVMYADNGMELPLLVKGNIKTKCTNTYATKSIT
jgi:hypothetical protein